MVFKEEQVRNELLKALQKQLVEDNEREDAKIEDMLLQAQQHQEPPPFSTETFMRAFLNLNKRM